jgi:hypothetical protein
MSFHTDLDTVIDTVSSTEEAISTMSTLSNDVDAAQPVEATAPTTAPVAVADFTPATAADAAIRSECRHCSRFD